MEKVLLFFTLKYKGDWDKIYKALESKEKIDVDLLTFTIKNIKCNWTTIISSDYPEALKYTYKPPFVIFYVGDLNVVNTNNKVVSFINSNEAINLVEEHTHVGLTSEIKVTNKSFLILDKGIYSYMIEAEEIICDLVMSESYSDYEMDKTNIWKNQLRFVSSVSESVVIDKYDQDLIEEVNSFSTIEDFKIYVKDKDGMKSKFSNVFNFSTN